MKRPQVNCLVTKCEHKVIYDRPIRQVIEPNGLRDREYVPAPCESAVCPLGASVYNFTPCKPITSILAADEILNG